MCTLSFIGLIERTRWGKPLPARKMIHSFGCGNTVFVFGPQRMGTWTVTEVLFLLFTIRCIHRNTLREFLCCLRCRESFWKNQKACLFLFLLLLCTQRKKWSFL